MYVLHNELVCLMMACGGSVFRRGKVEFPIFSLVQVHKDVDSHVYPPAIVALSTHFNCYKSAWPRKDCIIILGMRTSDNRPLTQLSTDPQRVLNSADPGGRTRLHIFPSLQQDNTTRTKVSHVPERHVCEQGDPQGNFSEGWSEIVSHLSGV